MKWNPVWLIVGIFMCVLLLFAISESLKGNVEVELSDPTMTEIGWREIVSRGVEPWSGVGFVKFSINNNPADMSSIRYCWISPNQDGAESAIRQNRKLNCLEAYIFSKPFGPLNEPTYFALRDGKILRADK